MSEITEPVAPALVEDVLTGPAEGREVSAKPPRGPGRGALGRIPARALLIAGIVVLVGVMTALAAHRFAFPPVGIAGSGTIQATQVNLAPKVPGRLERLEVNDGDYVRIGQLIAQLDRNDPSLEVRTAQANLAAASARLPQAEAALALVREQVGAGIAQSQAGVDEARSRVLQADQTLSIGTVTAVTEVDQATAQLRSARAALSAAQAALLTARGNARAAQATDARATADYARAEQLIRDGAIPAQQFDAARAAHLSAHGQRDATVAQVAVAEGQARAALQAVEQARAGLRAAQANRRSIEIKRLDVNATRARAEQSEATLATAQAQVKLVVQRQRDVEVARAALGQAQAALDQARLHLDETTLRAPFDGTVLSHEAEVGDLVGVGMPVVTIADLNRPYIWIYVSESDLARVKLGQPVDVTVDGLPGRTIHGRVSEISGQAEFTPSNVQTKEERVELVYGVKVTLPNPDGLLKPGLPADAVIRTDVHDGNGA